MSTRDESGRHDSSGLGGPPLDLDQFIAGRLGPPLAVLSGLVNALTGSLGIDAAELQIHELAAAANLEPVPVPDVVVATDGPSLLGRCHQALLTRGHRHRNGVFYTPATVTTRIASIALSTIDPLAGNGSDITVCDPAAGGGAFLLAAAEALAMRGFRPREIVECCLWGVDVDPLAIAVSEAALFIWAAERGDPPTGGNVIVGDTLRDGIDAWQGAPDGFDAVLGNPPFQNQLGTSTARDADQVECMRNRFGEIVRPYSDSATLFLVEALRLVKAGGRVALLLPQSFLMARDAAPARQHALEVADLVALWHCSEELFDARVRVCVPILQARHGQTSTEPEIVRAGRPTAPPRSPSPGTPPSRAARPLERFVGPLVEPAGQRPWRSGEPGDLATWSPLVADLLGVPDLSIGSGPVLGEHCRATAGFRDQYYGLVGHVAEKCELDGNPGDYCELVTAGMIDPGRVTWGRRPATFAGDRWLSPVVHLSRLDGKLRAWAEALLRPKVVVATQTKVIEPAVDEHGTWYPSVPVIAVIPVDPELLWHIAAVLLAPPVSVHAWQEHSGGSLSATTIKLAARELVMLPAPQVGSAWDRGAELARAVSESVDERSWRASLSDLGEVMCEAYGAGTEVLDWWMSRLPRWRD